jgi:hypothetical protein
VSELHILASGSVLSAQAELDTRWFDIFDLLFIFFQVTGLSVSGNPRIRFNFDTGTTSYAYSVSDNFGTPATGIAGVASGILLSSVSSTNPVVGQLVVGNGPQTHAAMLTGMAGVMDASAAPHIINGGGVWSNTAQITSVQLDAGPGGGNLNVGTGILILGVNP